MIPGADDEDDLFRAAMRNVRPLAASPRAPTVKQRPKPRLRNRLVDTDPPGSAFQLDGNILAGDELRYARPGVAATVLRKLRRGQLPIQAELDLHGATGQQAVIVLHGFLQQALARDVRCVRIIHGKGLRAGKSGPVLKQTVDALLRQHGQVVAFTSAAPDDGGTGAVHVLLKPA